MADGTMADVPVEVRPGRAPSNLAIASAWAEPCSPSHWTVAAARSAIDELDSGVFRSAACLAEAADRDCGVLGDLATRMKSFTSRAALPFAVEAGTGDKRRREAIRARVEELWWTSHPESVLSPIMRNTAVLHASVGRIYWLRSSSEWIPRLMHLEPHGLEFDSYERRYYYAGRDGTRHHVTPGDGTWFLHLPYGLRGFMCSPIRAIAEPYVARRYGGRDEGRWTERNGMSVLKVEEPHGATDDVTGLATEGAQGVYRDIRTGMTSGAVIRMPQPQSKDENGWDADWINPDGTGFEGIQASLKRNRDEITAALLGRSDESAKGGDGELASETRRNEFLSSDAEPLSTSLRDQVWKPFVAYNYDPNDLENAPWGRWDTKPPTSKKVRADVLVQLSTALPILQSMGVDCDAIVEEFGLKTTTEAGVKAPPKPPAPEPAPQNDETQTSSAQP